MGNRLKKIVDMIPKCNILADVGTDHAYVPIEACLRGICDRAIATDVREGPLVSAIRHINKFGLSDRIETRIGYGLAPLELDFAANNAIVIAGMGGLLISEILKTDINIAKVARSILLQPMNGVENLRHWLSNNGFETINEALVAENKKFYVVLEVKWTGIEYNLPLIYQHIGQKLIEYNDPLLKQYLMKQIHKYEKIIRGQSKAYIPVTELNRNICLLNNLRELYDEI